VGKHIKCRFKTMLIENKGGLSVKVWIGSMRIKDGAPAQTLIASKFSPTSTPSRCPRYGDILTCLASADQFHDPLTLPTSFQLPREVFDLCSLYSSQLLVYHIALTLANKYNLVVAGNPVAPGTPMAVDCSLFETNQGGSRSAKQVRTGFPYQARV